MFGVNEKIYLQRIAQITKYKYDILCTAHRNQSYKQTNRKTDQLDTFRHDLYTAAECIKS